MYLAAHASPPPPRRSRARRVRPAAGVSLAVTAAFGLVLSAMTAIGPTGSSAAAAGPTGEPAHPSCTVSSKAVPSCGRWIGVAPFAHTDVPLQTALPKDEEFAGRTVDIVHAYHSDWDLFPTATERAIALAPGHNRWLLLNWKPATDLSWSAVAAGQADARIDRLANYLKSTFRHQFFLDIWHEPENDVRATPGSGFTADDYAAMFRHVVSRLRADGVSWAITVMNYMGFVNWTKTTWFSHLWPGDSYVDWVATDPYGTGAPTSSYTATNLPTLVNRPIAGSFPGFYSWIQQYHPGKPMMLAEWGVGSDPNHYGGQARFFADVVKNIGQFPMLKALVYFDMPHPPTGQPLTYLAAEGNSSLAGYRTLTHNPAFVSPKWSYATH